VQRLVEEILPAVQERMRERGVALELDFPADLPEVRVDPMKLEQVLLEIVGNALDAMPGGGRLRIAAQPEPARDGRAAGGLVEIIDTGVGIPEHVLPSVCEPFFTTRPEGTGLGLAIARRFVEQHGGRLELVSRPGAGTTVCIRLPLEPVASTVTPAESPA
jgi:signal transduction histidine kinase